jgi:hypothetical protein
VALRYCRERHGNAVVEREERLPTRGILEVGVEVPIGRIETFGELAPRKAVPVTHTQLVHVVEGRERQTSREGRC